MADQFKTDDFRIRAAATEFFESEVEARMKEYGITLKVDGIEWDIEDIAYHGAGLEIITSTRKDRRTIKREVK